MGQHTAVVVYSTSPTTSDFLACMDSNGNITDLINKDGTIVASYTYSPYGEVVNSVSSEAQNNHFRFSTKYFDKETGLGYWGYRYYSPEMGRWVSRDPIGEPPLAGLTKAEIENNQVLIGYITFGRSSPDSTIHNSYAFIENHPIGDIDLFGLTSAGFREWQKCKAPRSWGPSPLGVILPEDGCSFPSQLGFMLPKGGSKDNPSGKCSFLTACNYHDLCYSDCNHTKAHCDAGFRSRMYGARNSRALGITNEKERKAFIKDCNKWADRYAWGVDGSIGEDAYKNRQQQNCSCTCIRSLH